MTLAEVWKRSEPFKWLMRLVGSLLTIAIVTNVAAVVQIHVLVERVSNLERRFVHIERRIWPLPGGAVAD